jgi:hypothetical protein
VPTVAIVDGVQIQFYWNDHPPPHFHAVIGGATALIEIRSLSVIEGDLPAGKLKGVLRWAEDHRRQLDAAWKAAERKQKLSKIE